MFHRIGSAAYKADLSNSIALDVLLRHPHLSFPSIHIAGTNGKGSTSNMLAAILQSAGYKTGLFTSPHLKDFRERIRVNGHLISKKYVSAFVQKHQSAFEKIEPSFFEWTVALAFDYFRYCKVDVAIIETGLGGRLDSTNIVTPMLSVITNIGLDHTNLLGNTLSKIALEKAGIIKHNVPLIVGEKQKNIQSVFVKKAKELKATLSFAEEKFSIKNVKQSVAFMHMDIHREGVLYAKQVKIELAGNYQKKNILTVFNVVEQLQQAGYKLPISAVRNGLEKVKSLTGFRGRWEVMGKKPLIVADTGHNIDGIKEVVRQINSIKYDQLHIVLGMVADKDISSILNLLPKEAIYYFSQANIPRALDAIVLKDNAVSFGLQGNVYASIKQAFIHAKKKAGPADLIFIGGSTFTVAEIL